MLDFPDADIAGTRAQLQRAEAIVAAVAPSALPIFRAARNGSIALVLPMRQGSLSRRILELSHRPVLILVGDDDETPTGPTGWACAKRLRYWGRRAMVHAAGAQAAHYETAVQGALMARRFVLVETTSEHRAAWERLFAPGMHILSIRTDEGDSHPILPPAREVN